MKVLVLDDDDSRLIAFKRGLIGNDVTTVKTAGKCISLLSSNDFDVIFLDHDLSFDHYALDYRDCGTGYDVAKWLQEHPDRKPKQIFIHSFSEPGRKRIKSCLPEGIECPGEWMKFK